MSFSPKLGMYRRNIMNFNNKATGRMHCNLLCIPVFVILFIALASGYSHSGTLMPKGLVINDKLSLGRGIPIGKVLSVQGNVIMIHPGDTAEYKADKELPVYERDTLITQKNGRVEILLNDESKLILASETKLELTKSVYDPKMKTRSSLINMAIGKARFLVTKQANFNSSQFKVKTNTAVAGVRGSDFVVTAKPVSTEISALSKTSLEVANTLWPDKITILSDYEKTIVRQDALPTPVERIPADEINQIQNELGGAIGSDISGVIINKFSGSNLTNVAIGKGSQANLGAIKIQGSKIKGVIVNEGSASNVTNVAIGQDATANTSSVIIK